MTPPVVQRHLIVNADDLGLSHGVNRGVVRAHEQGMVTSASLMVRGPGAAEAAALALSLPRLSVGLHVDLCEWAFVDDTWRLVYEVVPLDNAEAVAAEVARQLAEFRRLLGRDPTHLDSHQHAHHAEPLHSLLRREARARGLVLRRCHPAVQYCGAFYGQSNKGHPYPEGISVAALVNLLRNLPPGCTELGCHPGEGADVDSVYRHERAVECATLCDPQVRAAIDTEGIRLCSFSDRPQGGLP